jgi:Putative zinc- or iron-chelating domain
MSIKHHFANLKLEIDNFLAFLKAVLKFWDKRTRIIVWGTMTRQIKVYLFKRKTINYIEKHRKGSCINCLACCKYIRSCPYLTNENRCAIYEERHLICRIYPISDYDIQLVSKVSDKNCGYYFD